MATPSTSAPQITSPSGPPPPPTASAPLTTETDLLSALAHLSTLHAQLSALRPAITSLVQPLAALRPRPGSNPASRDDAAAAVREAAGTHAVALRALREEWEGERTRGVMGHVAASRGRDGDVRAGLEVGDVA